MSTRFRIVVIIIVGFIIIQLLLKGFIQRKPEYREISAGNPFHTLPPAEYLGTYVATMALGGFKPLIVDYLWMKQDKLHEEKQFEQIRLLLSIIARLQPHFPAVWSFNAYHMIYNIAYQEKTPEAKWGWVKSGLDYIREGMKYNPDNPNLTWWLAFFYYHRIPQDVYLMEMVERQGGRDTYEIAGELYQESANLYERENEKGQARLSRIMFSACRFLHAFEEIKKDRFSAAIQELQNLIEYTQDEKEKERLRDLIEVVKIDSETSKISSEEAQFIAQNQEVLSAYRDVIHKHLGYDFRPINSRVEVILTRLIKLIYRHLEQGKYEESLGVMKLLVEETNKITLPMDNTHPVQWYYLWLSDRFEKLQELVGLEINLRQRGGRTDAVPAGRQDVLELKRLYESYLKKYSRFPCTDEKERYNQLFK